MSKQKTFWGTTGRTIRHLWTRSRYTHNLYFSSCGLMAYSRTPDSNGAKCKNCLKVIAK